MEKLRELFLGKSAIIPNRTTTFMYFFYVLENNTTFQMFLGFLFLIIIVVFILYKYKTRLLPQTIVKYVICIYLVFSILIVKHLYNIRYANNTESSTRIQEIYSYFHQHIFSDKFPNKKTHITGELVESEDSEYKTSYKSPLKTNISLKMGFPAKTADLLEKSFDSTKKKDFVDINYIKLKSGDSCHTVGVIHTNKLVSTGNKVNIISQIPEKTNHRRSMTPFSKIDDELIIKNLKYTNILKEEIQKNKRKPAKIKRESALPLKKKSKTELNSVACKNTKSHNKNKDFKQVVKSKLTNPRKLMQNIESMNKTTDKNVLDVFLKYIEKTDKSSLKSVIEFKNQHENLNNTLAEFSEAFKHFDEVSKKIQTEMISFNANPKYMQDEACKLIEELKTLSEITDILNHQDYSIYLRDISKNEAIKYKELVNQEKNQEKTRKSKYYSDKIIDVIFVFSCLSVFFGLILFIGCFINIELTERIGILVILGLLSFNLIFGVYLGVNSHVIEHKCMVGNIEGCNLLISDKSLKFAAAGNINLLNTDRQKENKTESIVMGVYKKIRQTELQLYEYLEHASDEKIIYMIEQFNHFVEKIFFVEDGFCDLIRNKISKELFYGYLKTIRNDLLRFKYMVLTLKRAELVNLYRSIIEFRVFISKEKEKIITGIADRAGKINKELLGNENNERCKIKRKTACQSIKKYDNLSVLCIVGSIILMIILII